MENNRRNKRAKAGLARAAVQGKRLGRALRVPGRPAIAGYPPEMALITSTDVTGSPSLTRDGAIRCKAAQAMSPTFRHSGQIRTALKSLS